jgi:lipopolysaccharide/colanic/teichoic acid biosynthesis glycosyltransferase
LLELESSSSVKLELLFEQLGLEEPQTPSDYQSAFHFSDVDIEQIERRPYWKVKRAIDFLTAAIVLVLTLPIMALVALLVAIDVGSPILFAQQRPGRYGIPFRVYKFRTMAAAHDRQGRRVPDAQRTSIIGHFLRRSRCDELPQVFSILAGEMSFVGPRPLLPIDQPPAFVARLLVPPGLTGWAQVNGGRDVSAADKAALDVWYVQNASLLLDLRILLRTVPMVVFGERISRSDIQRAWGDLYSAGICSEGLGDCDVPTTVSNIAA